MISFIQDVNAKAHIWHYVVVLNYVLVTIKTKQNKTKKQPPTNKQKQKNNLSSGQMYMNLFTY